MNKGELISALAGEAGNTRAEATKYMNCFIDVVSESLAKKHEINLTSFGKFYTTKREACVSKNHRTGETIDIPAYNSPKFKTCKKLKQKLINYCSWSYITPQRDKLNGTILV